ncbi:G-protein coupled receptor family C group 6 member A-like [Leptodactylus fuscus]
MIGGLFPIHKEIPALKNYTSPEDLLCEGFQMTGFLKSLGMIYAIEKINNLNFLPGLTLGYEIYDTCSNAGKALQETIRLTSEWEPPADHFSQQCNISARPSVKAVIGALYSEVSITIARHLSFKLIPQISYGSSAEILGDKHRFPSFLRTVPNEIYLTKALSILINKFHWNYVGIVSSDDDYGRSLVENLSVQLDLLDICTAFKDMIPADVGDQRVHQTIHSIIGRITGSSANVIILALKVSLVVEVLKEIVKHNISRTWIATDHWSDSQEVAKMIDIDNIGCVIGFSFKHGEIPGFRKYLHTLESRNHSENPFIKEYLQIQSRCLDAYKHRQCLQASNSCTISGSILEESYLNCSEDNIYLQSDDYLERSIEPDRAYSTYLAVQAIAEAIKNLLCSNGSCIHNTTFPPWQLLQEVKKVKFSDNNETVYFDGYGDFNTGFDLLSWHKINNSIEFIVAGVYDIDENDIILSSYDIIWNTPNNEIPESRCSKSCSPGKYKIHSNVKCCYNCSLCPEGYYSDAFDMTECRNCLPHQWSDKGSSYCKNKMVEYLDWVDPFAGVLLSFAAFGVLLVVIIGIVFLKYLSTPAVKAAGGIYTFIMNVSLLASYISSGFFIGQPSDLSCMIRQPLYGISFTVCVSCILVKALRIVLAFELGQRICYHVKLTYQPAIVIIILTSIQAGICIVWLALKPPSVQQIPFLSQYLIQQCHEGSTVAYGIMLAYIAFLAFVCFVLAYKERKLPDIYNEGRFITFSMLIYIFVWFAFIPLYVTTKGKYLPAVELLAILTSNYGIVCCHLLPTTYILFFKSFRKRSISI